MCKRCKDIDAHIARYELLLKSETVDKIYRAGLDEILRNLRAEKGALHPEEK